MAGRRRLMFAKDFTVDYLKFTALESGTFTFTIGSSVTSTYLEYVEYSTDEGVTWVKTDNVSNQTVTITTPTITTGDSVLWRGSGIRIGTTNTTSGAANYSNFYSTGRCNVSGNINTLLGLNKPDNVEPNTYMYKYLFYNMTTLVDASELILPSFTSYYMYYYAFYGCSSLVSMPKLPATVLSGKCYSYMFYGCTSLITTTPLPALTTPDSCYNCMFYNCTSLTTAPELPATTLGSYCYQSMFNGCSSLVNIPSILPASNLSSNCYRYMFSKCVLIEHSPVIKGTVLGSYSAERMFSECSSLKYIHACFVSMSESACLSSWVLGVASAGTFVKHPLSTWETGDSGIPNGWVVQNDTSFITNYNPQYSLTPAGYLTFTHLEQFYLGLISKHANYTIYVSKNGTNWHSLQTTDCLEFGQNDNCYVCGYATTGQNSSSYTRFAIGGNVIVSGNCNYLLNYESSSSSVVSYAFYRLFYGCKGLDLYNFTLPATSTGNYCYSNMFYGCISLTNVPNALPATSLTSYCYQYMFYQCSNITTAPELPATSLSSYCYNYMFRYCTKLNYVKALFTTTPSSSYTSYWLGNTSSTGIFVKNINATWTTTGNHGVPSGWTIIYYDPSTEKYYQSDKTTECDDHGNPL